MSNHELETNYKKKSGDIVNFRCKVCSSTWVNKPTSTCKGKPFNQSTKSSGQKQVYRTQTSVRMGGELARIDAKYVGDPAKRREVRGRYLKNERPTKKLRYTVLVENNNRKTVVATAENTLHDKESFPEFHKQVISNPKEEMLALKERWAREDANRARITANFEADQLRRSEES